MMARHCANRRRAVASLALLASLAAAILPAVHSRELLASPACEELMGNVREGVFKSLIWPRSATVFLSGQLPSAWSGNVSGELQPSGTYYGTENVLDFFFGYAGPTSTNRSQNQDMERITDIEVVWIACNATTRIVTAETFITFRDGYGNFIYMTDVIHVYRFNKQRRICGFSLTSKRQEIIIDSRPLSTVPALVIPQVCGAVQALCTGVNQQYANVTDCIAFMSSITFGTSADLDQNNVLCRRQNLPMAEFQPDAYCSALGPSGGTRCIPHGLSSQYLVKDFIQC